VEPFACRPRTIGRDERPFGAQSTVFRLLLAAFFVFHHCRKAQSVDSLPKPTDYVSDYAHVLSPEAVARLDSLCAQLDHSQANAQIAMVTVQTWTATMRPTTPTSLKTSGRWARRARTRACWCCLAVGDHKYRIDVGYGLEGILNDAKVGDIGREMVPYLRANDYDSP
jgi:uncharacterized protein